jgi:hypothetical protein
MNYIGLCEACELTRENEKLLCLLRLVRTTLEIAERGGEYREGLRQAHAQILETINCAKK